MCSEADVSVFPTKGLSLNPELAQGQKTPANLPASTSPTLGLQACSVVPIFYQRTGDLNPGPHVFIESNLSTEPSPSHKENFKNANDI